MKKWFTGSLLVLLLQATTAIAADPCSRAGGWLPAGMDHLRRGSYDEALSALDRAVAEAPRCARAYYGRGLVLDMTGRHDRAIEEYSLTLQEEPGDAAAYYRRGLAYGRKGHFDRETEDYSKATALADRKSVV